MSSRRLCLLLILGFVRLARADSEPWTAPETLSVDQLSAALAHPDRVHVLMVGPRVLFNGGHIPGAIYAGPAGKPEGLATLVQAVSPYPKDASIVLYCGCCPMEKCPNIRPAFLKLKQSGYRNVKVLIIPTNLHDDWTAKGHPVEKGEVPR